MNEKEISEIRRRFRLDKNNISHIRGCYVNQKGEIVSQFNQSLVLMPQEEAEELLTVLRRTLSGTPGKNLLDITFSTQQVVNSEEHKLLMELRNSQLKNEDTVQTLFNSMAQSLNLEGNYLILLAYDTYDIPFRSKDNQRQDDASSEVFSYILCGICPIKVTKLALSYYVSENEFHNRQPDWLVAPPELGFMFPAFDDRSANIYNALYYTRNIAENHELFVKEIFKCDIPMAAAAQKETFQSVLSNALAEDCNYEVVQAVHEQLYEAIEEHKANKEEGVPTIAKKMVKQVLQNCGVSEPRMASFEENYDAGFGSDAKLSAQNIIDSKRFEICTPNVTIRVKPECSSLVETRVIDGKKYILIRADEGVEVNGVNIHIS